MVPTWRALPKSFKRMAAMVAKWNSCTFCVGAHGAIAAKEMPRRLVDDTLGNFRGALLPYEELRSNRRVVPYLGQSSTSIPNRVR